MRFCREFSWSWLLSARQRRLVGRLLRFMVWDICSSLLPQHTARKVCAELANPLSQTSNVFACRINVVLIAVRRQRVVFDKVLLGCLFGSVRCMVNLPVVFFFPPTRFQHVLPFLYVPLLQYNFDNTISGTTITGYIGGTARNKSKH